MVYNIALADRLREQLSGTAGLTEKKMFSGIGYIVCALLLAAGVLRAQSFDAQLGIRLQTTLDSLRAALDMKGVSAAVLIPGEGLWLGTSGYSHADVPVTPGMEFGIGSNSKLFTAVTLLKLAENDILSLEDSLHKWLPAYTNIDSHITIRQLLNHTSGIEDVNVIPGYADSILSNPQRVFTRDEVIRWTGPPRFPAGTSWSYSNTNYLLAGMIVERASGRPFVSLLRESLLAPLQLDDTFLPVEDTIHGNIAHPWLSNVDIDSVPRVSLLSAAWAAGAMYSTAGDMARWYDALMSGRVLRPESFKQMTTFVGSGNYGFGLTEKTVSGRLMWVHSGLIRGYTSQMFYDTTLKAVICVLVNAMPASASFIAQQLLLILVNSSNTAIAELPLPETSVQVFPNPSSDLIHISTPGERLRDVELFNLFGTRVRTHFTPEFSTASLPRGIYFIRVRTERSSVIQRIVLR